jgi:hypothetical protein
VSNTAIAFTGIIAVTAMVWTVSANNEVRVCFVCVGLPLLMSVQRRTVQPKRPIPSMLVRVIVHVVNATLTFVVVGKGIQGKERLDDLLDSFRNWVYWNELVPSCASSEMS